MDFSKLFTDLLKVSAPIVIDLLSDIVKGKYDKK